MTMAGKEPGDGTGHADRAIDQRRNTTSLLANAIRAKLPVVAIGYERTGFHPAEVRKDELTPDESLVVAEHFAERARQEDAFFGADNAFASEGSGCGVRMIESGELNSPETLGFLEGRNVDTVVVYGAQPDQGAAAGSLARTDHQSAFGAIALLSRDGHELLPAAQRGAGVRRRRFISSTRASTQVRSSNTPARRSKRAIVRTP